MTRETKILGSSVLVLREPKTVPEKPHQCPIEHGDLGVEKENGAIIQCTCGKRYRCRPSLLGIDGEVVWVRRLLPWPPKQSWPINGKDN